MKYIVQLAALVALPLGASAAHAATSFTDRSAFIAQTSPQGMIDFNSAQAGSSFENQDLTVGNITLRGGFFPFDPPGGINFIAPGGRCTNVSFFLAQIDGSQFACAFVADGIDLSIDFNAPVTAWGAEFKAFVEEDIQVKFSFFDADAALVADYIAEGLDPLVPSFIGLDFMGQDVTQLIFSILPNPDKEENFDAFGMDNMVFAFGRGAGTPNPVPVPPALLLFGSAGAAFAGLRRIHRLER
ncbi:MAG: hypothetical protein AAF607_04910 [Pseudomonadota bacterium]